MAVRWDASLTTGISIIDSQHRQLIDTINSLLEAMACGNGSKLIESTITFLETYTNTHFRDEERLLREANYPAFAAHKALHDRFVQDLAAIRAGLTQGRSTTALTIEVQRKIGDWLVQHIKKEDVAYAPHLNKAA